MPFFLDTAPLRNSWIIIIVWLYIALNRTPNIDWYCGGGGAVPNFFPIFPVAVLGYFLGCSGFMVSKTSSDPNLGFFRV